MELCDFSIIEFIKLLKFFYYLQVKGSKDDQ